MTEVIYEGQCDLSPSVNAIYRATGVSGARRGDRSKTKLYSNWRTLACIQLGRRKKPLEGPLNVLFTVGQCNRARDLDNCLKALLDLLVSLGWIKDDNMMTVTSIGIRYRPNEVPKGQVYIHVLTDEIPTKEIG